MEIVYWSIISILFIIGFVGLVYPIIPSVLFLLAGYILYGVFFSFEHFSLFFWLIKAFLLFFCLSQIISPI
jgi:uncharacterized protein